jgi:predicted RNase H-like nuclease (RuvC/YqgF family)
MAKNEIEFEFGESSGIKAEPIKKTETPVAAVSETKIETATATAPTQKIEEPIVKEPVEKGPSVLEKIETWLKNDSGMKFWLKVKAIFVLPVLIILIISIATCSNTSAKAKSKIADLTQEKTAVETQLGESNAKITELDETIAKLQENNEKLTTENANLRRRLQPARAAPAKKPAPKR